MSLEHRRKVARAFERVVSVPADRRGAALDEACDGDDTVRAEVEDLLHQDLALDDSSLFEGVQREIAREARTALDDFTGQPERIGPYRILGPLGVGGMGIVYRAEQSNPHRTVALKVIHPGLLSPAALRRFEFETEVLGRLHHPGIAQIHEAGVAELPEQGARIPYFAMELVEGRPLIEYADASGLGTRERLELLARVCDAVHHAHQKGVIHRDLKPGNILVAADGIHPGEPKVLDFGVARAASADEGDLTVRTLTGQLIGTLPYMSPEQVAGDPDAIDIRSDVYALGVILHELLCGELPIDPGTSSVPEAARRILEEEPRRLGRRDSRYRGDIETIVAKALEKEPERRYGSSADLAADLRRCLRDEPISARPASRIYQLGKFARRHRTLVVGSTMIVMVLISGLGAERVQRRKAERARAEEHEQRLEAERARADMKVALEGSEKVARFISELFASATPASGGRDVTVREKLAGVDERLREFEDQPGIESRIRSAIGETFIGLGEFQLARVQLERAVELRVELLGEDHPDTLHSRVALATVLLDLGEREESLRIADECREKIAEELGPHHLRTLNARGVVALARQRLGQEGAEEEFEEIIEAARAHLGPDDSVTLGTMNNLAVLFEQEGRLAEAEPLFREIHERRRHLNGDDHPATINSRNNLGFLLVSMQRYDEALPHLEDSYERAVEVLGPTHPHTRLYGNNLGVCYFALERYEEARPFFEAAVEQNSADFGPEHRLTLISRGNYAGLLRKTGDLEGAIARFPEILEGLRRVYPPGHPYVASFEQLYGLALRDAERYEDAEPVLVGALQVFDRQYGPDHPRTRDVRTALVELYERWGRPERADPYRDPEAAADSP